eukprot:c821_g1_i1.p1 GENE.c821_g1_i1~~c821_g1_i1.p1  ORF type:complete len:266 (+),score=59.45 c821_g1_i1:1-798(+)
MLNAPSVVAGCAINHDKSRANFHTPLAKNFVEGNTFVWCGLRFDTRTLEVHTDHSRLNRAGDGLSVQRRGTPGFEVLRRLLRFVRQRCHFIFLAPSLQSRQSAARNVFDVLCVSAIRLHCYYRELRKSEVHRGSHFPFLRRILESCIKTTFSRVLERAPPMGPEIIRFCGLRAFLLVLGRKQTVYRELLHYITKQLARLKQCAGHQRTAAVKASATTSAPTAAAEASNSSRKSRAMRSSSWPDLFTVIEKEHIVWFAESFTSIKY